MISPVTALAKSDSRNAATLPTSSMVTLRRNGAVFSTKRRILENPPMPAAASVLIGPAEIALTRIPSVQEIAGQRFARCERDRMQQAVERAPFALERVE